MDAKLKDARDKAIDALLKTAESKGHSDPLVVPASEAILRHYEAMAHHDLHCPPEIDPENSEAHAM